LLTPEKEEEKDADIQAELFQYALKDDLKDYPRALALYDYEPAAQGDLRMAKGDEVIVLDKTDEQGWWIGMIGDRRGLFPSTYAELIKKDSRIPKKVSEKKGPTKEPKKGDILIALVAYKEQGPEEISFETGDSIVLEMKDPSGWWLGKPVKGGSLGWFPPALVKLERK